MNFVIILFLFSYHPLYFFFFQNYSHRHHYHYYSVFLQFFPVFPPRLLSKFSCDYSSFLSVLFPLSPSSCRSIFLPHVTRSSTFTSFPNNVSFTSSSHHSNSETQTRIYIPFAPARLNRLQRSFTPLSITLAFFSFLTSFHPRHFLLPCKPTCPVPFFPSSFFQSLISASFFFDAPALCRFLLCEFAFPLILLPIYLCFVPFVFIPFSLLTVFLVLFLFPFLISPVVFCIAFHFPSFLSLLLVPLKSSLSVYPFVPFPSILTSSFLCLVSSLISYPPLSLFPASFKFQAHLFSNPFPSPSNFSFPSYPCQHFPSFTFSSFISSSGSFSSFPFPPFPSSVIPLLPPLKAISVPKRVSSSWKWDKV